MSIIATRIEHLAPRLGPTQTQCWRCPAVFDHSAENVLPGSPCRDCRDVLRAEGDTTRWRRQGAA